MSARRDAMAKQARELAEWLNDIAEALEGGWPEPPHLASILDTHARALSDTTARWEALVRIIEARAATAKKEHVDRRSPEYWVEAAWGVVDECRADFEEEPWVAKLADNVRLLARAIHAAAHPGGRGQHAPVPARSSRTAKDSALLELCRAVGFPWVERDSAKRTKRRQRAKRPGR